MVSLIFLYAALYATLTGVAFALGQVQDARSLLFYAGALLICAFFGLNSRLHGFAGAAVLSSLALFSTCSRIWPLLQAGQEPNPTALLLNTAGATASACFLFVCFAVWQKGRQQGPPPEEEMG